jgi:hypothetical protein
MAHITNVTCVCDLEVSDANEYEALEEVIKMIEKKYELSNKVSIIIKETVTTTSFGCGVNYDYDYDYRDVDERIP